MGLPLKPLCIATNQEYVYFAAKAVRYTSAGVEGDLLCAVVRSDRLPASLVSTNWTLVSTFPAPWIEQNPTLNCHVDRNGAFSFEFWKNPTFARYTFDPTALIDPAGRTVTPANSTHGEWNNVLLVMPSEAKSAGMTRNIQLEDANGTAVEMLVYNNALTRVLPPRTLPYIYSGLYTKTGEYDRSTFSSAAVSITNGAIYNLKYGDGLMFALLYVGTPFRIGNSVVDRYNRSIVHIPFMAPPSSNSFQLPAGTPWKADDCISEDESTLAVAKGKLYFVCGTVDEAILKSYGTLYIHDSKTNLTQVSAKFDGNLFTDIYLAYGPNSQDDPQFAIVRSTSDIYYAIALSSVNASAVILSKVLDNVTVSENLMAPIPPPPRCDDSCGWSNSMRQLFIMVTAIGLVFLACICVVVRVCAKTKGERRRAVQDAPTATGTHGPGDEYDVELPPYSPRAEDPRIHNGACPTYD